MLELEKQYTGSRGSAASNKPGCCWAHVSRGGTVMQSEPSRRRELCSPHGHVLGTGLTCSLSLPLHWKTTQVDKRDRFGTATVVTRDRVRERGKEREDRRLNRPNSIHAPLPPQAMRLDAGKRNLRLTQVTLNCRWSRSAETAYCMCGFLRGHLPPISSPSVHSGGTVLCCHR